MGFKFGKNIKKVLMIGVTALSLSLVLGGCGNNAETSNDASSAVSSAVPEQGDNAVANELMSKYGTYIESYKNDFSEFINDDFDKILNGIGSINDGNYAQWKAVYEKGLDNTSHWYSEIGAAEMICPPDKTEAHEDLVKTVGTIYKILEGLESRVEAADSGDYAELNDMADEYKQANDIAKQMWDYACEAFK